ncbi:kinesin K39 [Rhodotorula toruloides]|uniref:Kinesin K39 n=1 Tax=Rhodotorula toruloides TaxID=5286 RepID=A0A511KNQ7_RHOTO|nr:kinesin K39 [Rhodotorula toruloides]
MAPSTRSAKEPRLNFGASKARAAAPPTKTTTTGPADAITKLFRREFAAMISVPPSNALALESGDPRKSKLSVEVLAMNQQISSDGTQSTLQICAAVDSKGREVGERWVNRSVGFREFFPLVGRVPKRPRQLEDEDEERNAGMDDEEAESRKKRTNKPHPVKRSKTDPTWTSSSSRRNRDKSSKSSSSSRHERPSQDAGEDVDSGDETETGLSSYGRGKRACHGRSTASGSAVASTSRMGTSPLPYELRPVKSEDAADELSSLCGAVDDLAVRTTVEPETDAELGTSTRRSQKGKGKAIA